MSTINIHRQFSPPRSTLATGRRADFTRVGMLLMLFANIALVVMLVAGDAGPPLDAAQQWHGNASGAAMK